MATTQTFEVIVSGGLSEIRSGGSDVSWGQREIAVTRRRHVHRTSDRPVQPFPGVARRRRSTGHAAEIAG